MQVSISHSAFLSQPFAQSLCLSLSFSVILRGSADSGGMIEEGLVERRGKWSANGTLSPIGHLLTLHSPAAHSVVVGMCVWARVQVWARPLFTCGFSQFYLSWFSHIFRFLNFFFYFSKFCILLCCCFFATSLFNCLLQGRLIPKEIQQCYISLWELIRSCQARLKTIHSWSLHPWWQHNTQQLITASHIGFVGQFQLPLSWILNNQQILHPYKTLWTYLSGFLRVLCLSFAPWLTPTVTLFSLWGTVIASFPFCIYAPTMPVTHLSHIYAWLY